MRNDESIIVLISFRSPAGNDCFFLVVLLPGPGLNPISQGNSYLMRRVPVGNSHWRGGLNPSGILGGFAPMRWLMIGLLVSLGALLFAAAGVARHIWLQRRKDRREMLAALEAAQGTDVEVEP